MKIVTEKIIELAQAGERDPNDLCEPTLSFFRERLGSVLNKDSNAI